MKLIIKNKPADLHHKLVGLKKDINGTFGNLSKELKSELLKSLLDEQSFICAYCMQKINEKNATIEHIIGQNYIDENDNKLGEQNQLNYHNLLAVCNGKSCNKELHCDKNRANYQQKNPKRRLFVTPLENRIVQNIKFTPKGMVYYDEFTEIKEIEKLKDYDSLNEIENIKYDIQKVLNLNCENLKGQRLNLIDALKKFTNNWQNKERVRKKLDEYSSNPSSKFSQVVIYHLSKKLKSNN